MRKMKKKSKNKKQKNKIIKITIKKYYTLQNISQ